MKKVFLIGIAMLFSGYASAQHFALKNNLVYDATATPNLGMEVGLGKKVTLDISAGYNPFEFNHDKQFKHWLGHAGLRFWSCEKFNGTFFGIYGLGGQYDVSGFKLPFKIFKKLENHRYDGYLYGGGISIGHQWVLSKRWSIEAEIGAGYARMHYDEYEKGDNKPKIHTGNHNYWGVTKASLSFVYFIH